jgi:T5orf172 domain
MSHEVLSRQEQPRSALGPVQLPPRAQFSVGFMIALNQSQQLKQRRARPNQKTNATLLNRSTPRIRKNSVARAGEVAKEEDTIRRAMERAQKEFAVAGEEQRAKYELQLQELAARLQEAEERGQRALSMAQQTKRGHVYIISNIGSFGGEVFKIGLTRRLEPLDRVKELGDASVPFEFDVHAMIFSEDAPALEHSLHRHFVANQLNKVNPRKEFFRASLAKIRDEVEKLGISASWTIAAAAMQFRESQAIERAIKDDPNAYQSWVKRQLVIESRIEEADEDSNVSPGIQAATVN